MFQKFVPASRCPEYTGFSLIVVKPSESHVEPERASSRLRKGLAMLIYAQQWFAKASNGRGPSIYTDEVATEFTKILDVLEDENAIWHSAGEKMRPVNVLLDLYGNLYDRLNCLQNDIKALSTQPAKVARDKSAHVAISRDATGIRAALKELRQVMEAMPRYKSSTPAQEDERHDVGDYSDFSEDEDIALDSKFGILLASATAEELTDLRRHAQKSRRKRLRKAHVYSVGSDVDPQSEEDESRSIGLQDDRQYRDNVRLDSVFQAYRDFEEQPHAVSSNSSSQSSKSVTVASLDSGDSAITVSPRRSVEVQHPRFAAPLKNKFTYVRSQTVVDRRKDLLAELQLNNQANDPSTCPLEKVQLEALITSKIAQLDQDVQSDSTASQVEDECASDLDDLEEASLPTVYTIATRVTLSDSSRTGRLYKKPVILQKHKRNESGVTIYERRPRCDSMVLAYEQFQLPTNKYKPANHDMSDDSSLEGPTTPSTAVSSLSSAQCSPVFSKSKFVQLAGL